jgi:hypothetical protein
MKVFVTKDSLFRHSHFANLADNLMTNYLTRQISQQRILTRQVNQVTSHRVSQVMMS